MAIADVMPLLFAIVNSLRILAYLPQIIVVWRDSRGADAVSIWTWMLFAISNATTMAYASVTLHDNTMVAIFAVNTVCCIAVALVTGWKRIPRS